MRWAAIRMGNGELSARKNFENMNNLIRLKFMLREIR
jgi:hypothetical protein